MKLTGPAKRLFQLQCRCNRPGNLSWSFQPWGCVFDGKLDWQGEDEKDFGVIHVEGNNVFRDTLGSRC